MQYSISLTIGDKTYKGEGATPEEALSSLEKPAKLMNKGIVRVTDGETNREILMTPVQLKRLFYNSPGILKVKAKQVFMLRK